MTGLSKRPPFAGVFGNAAPGRILRALLSAPDHLYTIPDLAETSASSNETAYRAVQVFIKLQMVEKARTASTLSIPRYRLRKDSDIVKAVDGLVDALNFELAAQAREAERSQ